jgi:hypothetical protein
MSDGFNNRPNIAQQLTDNIAGQASGILSTRPTAKYSSGARCILKVNDKVVGFAFGISWKITTQNTEIMTIDDYLPYELAPQRVFVEGTISALHIPGQSATVELWQPDVLSFLFHKYISIEVRDSQTDQVLFATRKAVITSKVEEVKVDQLSNVSLSWKAIGWLDERKPELPDNYNKLSPQSANPRQKSTLATLLGKLPFGL